MKNCPKCGCDLEKDSKEPEMEITALALGDEELEEGEEGEGSEDEKSIKLELLDELMAEIKAKVFKSKLDKFKE